MAKIRLYLERKGAVPSKFNSKLWVTQMVLILGMICLSIWAVSWIAPR